MSVRVEHINFTVPDAKATAAVLCDLFDWTIRWEGAAIGDGYTVHVGESDSYVALYTPPGNVAAANATSFTRHAGLNHIGLTVPDLDAAEMRVKAAGFTPRSHGDYEPGRRFYFDGPDGVEYELVSYA